MERFSHDGFTFDVREWAPAARADEPRDTVVALHGFPQTSAAWTQVATRLADAGVRTLAPDQRGYSPGARPQDRSAYRMHHLVGDVVALLDAAGLDRVHLVGHDWGGGVAWAFALRHPERVARLTVLSTPHTAAMQWATRHSTQGLRSWYMAAFQLPVLPEAVLGRLLRGSGGRMGLPAEQERAYRDALAQPGALTGAINWYRALAWQLKDSGGDPLVTCPTTYVWGRRDRYLGRAAAEKTEEYVDAPYRFVEIDADHWLPEKQPDEVAAAILEPVTP